jgi:hypothetical protein
MVTSVRRHPSAAPRVALPIVAPRHRFAAVAAGLLLSSMALAQAKQKALGQELSGGALQSFEQAKNLFEASDFATAHAKFKQAYEGSRNPRIFWNMAACSVRLKRYARAIEEAERYLAEGRSRLTAEQIEKANGALAEWRSFVAEATLKLDPGEATLHVDDEPRGVVAAQATLYLDMGKHELRFEKAGYEPLTKVIAIGEVGKPTFALTMKSLAAAPAHLLVNTDLGAAIELDGKPHATKGFFDGKLQPGVHRLRITAPGKLPYDSMLELAAGATKQLSVSLTGDNSALAPSSAVSPAAPTEGQEEKAGSAWWPWAVGGAVLAAGAGVGAYYIFKPEQVPGRTAYPGLLGTVEFR